MRIFNAESSSHSGNCAHIAKFEFGKRCWDNCHGLGQFHRRRSTGATGKVPLQLFDGGATHPNF